MLDAKILTPILEKYDLVLVENRYLKGKNYEDGTVTWDAVIESIVTHKSVPSAIFEEIGKLLNPPLPKKMRTKKTTVPDTTVSTIRKMDYRGERNDGQLRGEAGL